MRCGRAGVEPARPDVLALQGASCPSLLTIIGRAAADDEPPRPLAAARRSADQLDAIATALADMTAAVRPLATPRHLAFHRAVCAPRQPVGGWCYRPAVLAALPPAGRSLIP